MSMNPTDQKTMVELGWIAEFTRGSARCPAVTGRPDVESWALSDSPSWCGLFTPGEHRWTWWWILREYDRICIYIYLDSIGTFSAHSSFCLDLCSLGHFTLTWTKGAHLCLDGRLFTLISILVSKQSPGRSHYAHLGQKLLKNHKSLKWVVSLLSAFSRMQVHTHIYIILYASLSGNILEM